MKKMIALGFVAAVLAGCGGGGGSTAATPPAATTPTAPVVTAPAVSANASTVAAASATISGNGLDYLVKSASKVDLIMAAQISNLWIADNQAMGSVIVSGSMNTIVFRPGATVQSLTVSGTANVIYLPIGSPIKVEGLGAGSTTVKFYTP